VGIAPSPILLSTYCKPEAVVTIFGSELVIFASFDEELQPIAVDMSTIAGMTLNKLELVIVLSVYVNVYNICEITDKKGEGFGRRCLNLDPSTGSGQALGDFGH
jgi:hypothetical protein